MNTWIKRIGVIHTSLVEKKDAPIQSSRSDLPGTVEVFPQYLEGLDGVEEFSHIYLLYGFHRSEPEVTLKVRPFLDDQMHGIFSTRYPCRPNPLGLSVVRLVKREGNLLLIKGADMLDGTPLWDIKPYVPEFDVFSVEKMGWYANRKYL
ncbi:MAG: tRNA (N6-threonylcarbamoyladenosine(37)-N6)-methyltransferase TrmO [Chloroflexi bacterium]|nr:MAG: tRNA (N6-threonylcarbamoyladenosine(37)-N6)-methyltransferase TrmO [Chloroflexota bacterium]